MTTRAVGIVSGIAGALCGAADTARRAAVTPQGDVPNCLCAWVVRDSASGRLPGFAVIPVMRSAVTPQGDVSE